MTPRRSITRRLARALAAHAGRVLPPSCRARDEWAAAMRAEVDAIESDGPALRWALGCVIAGYAERIEAMNFFDTVAVRGLLIFFIALEVLSNLFATVATVAYKTGHMGLLLAMSGQMPGDDYHPFIPIMNAIPWWDHALWVSAAVLYLVSAILLFTSRRTLAFPLFATGFALALVGQFGSRIVMAQAGLQPVVGRAGSIIGRIIQAIPEYILPLAIVLALWMIWRSRAPTQAAAEI